jgi:FMN phosphatase YigB (HAD superfamily)
MSKKILIIVVLVLTIVGARFYLKKMRARSLVIYSRPAFDIKNKPVILWDIHDVILHKNKAALFSYIWQLDTKKEILACSSWPMARDMLWAFYYMFKTGSTGEEFVGIAQKYGNTPLAQAIISIANNCQELIPDTAAVIQELHAQGYRQHIGSNIGAQIFQDLLERSLFSDIFNNTIFELLASQVVSYNPDFPEATIKKPQAQFYREYLAKNNLAPEQVILIDDKIENVLSAQRVGMYGLVFRDAAQLKKDLWLLLGDSPTEPLAKTGI